jgi:dTMP kinase
MPGHLIAFEGLDQSGKQTQAARLAAALAGGGHRVHQLSFPDYHTAIGVEIGRALHGERDYAADTLQLLYIANRYEYRPRIEAWLASGAIVVCDRFLASSVAYGEAQGLDPRGLMDVQRGLPPPALTVLLDIAPDASLTRKQAGRDTFERDLALLERVAAAYRRMSDGPGWVRVDGRRDKEAVADDVLTAVWTRLSLP